MDLIREHIYLAALLHDIGKFYQRADIGGISNSKYLKEHCKDESSFCPQYVSGKYSHKHVLWTAQFIEDYASVFKNLVRADMSNLSDKDNLLNLAAGHHLKSEQISILGNIIKEADCLSSGMDRSSDEALRDSQDEEIAGWDSFKKKRMISILQTIKNPNTVYNWHLPVNAIDLTRNSFPQKEFSVAPDYSALWADFISEFKFIQADTYHAFSETLLNLLYKYTTTIPSSTINFPDISLYDHLKTTAAIAVCLYDFYQENNQEGSAPFLLIGGDFSGIQNYIYQIVSKYAGKNLKGRSFYLRLLSDAVVRYLLKELNLFQANVIYNSGGGFYILAPNTSEVKRRLQKAIAMIEQKLFKHHGTMLYVAIDSVPLSKDALMHQNGSDLGKVWKRLFELRDLKKNAKFSSLLKIDYNAFFTPTQVGGNAQRDTITGEEFAPNEKIFNAGDLVLKELTYRQIDLGKKLRETNYIVIKHGEPLSYWNNRVHIAPADLGVVYYFIETKELTEMREILNASADDVSIITLNGKSGKCDFPWDIKGVNNIYGIDFYGGNEIAHREMPTFEDLCSTGDNLKRLGVLRMDVDNLGSIFQKGIPAERATLSRYASLSRAMDYFFSGYINTIWQEVDPKHSFIIYSGGDDLFIVASWDIAIKIAERIKNDFAQYTCNNKSFSLSAGIAILSSKYPIMKGAEDSAGEETLAKNHKSCGDEKNSISFMAMPLNWDNEYLVVKNLKSEIVALLQQDKMPKSFISKLIAHHENARIINHKVTGYKTFWMLTYDLSRMKERYRKFPETLSLINNCINEVCGKSNLLNGSVIKTQYHPLELWTFAARWAELENRTNN